MVWTDIFFHTSAIKFYLTLWNIATGSNAAVIGSCPKGILSWLTVISKAQKEGLLRSFANLDGESVVQQYCHRAFAHTVFVTHCLFKVLDTGRVTPLKLSFVIYLSRKPQFTLNVWFPVKSWFYFQLNFLRHKEVKQPVKGHLLILANA